MKKNNLPGRGVLPMVLAIIDGWGVARSGSRSDDATVIAKTPFLNEVIKHYPRALLKASGEAVGLPKGQDGNSEAGHLNLGAGRIVCQDSVFISQSIRDGTFFKNQTFRTAIEHVKARRSAMHLMGLLSNYNSGHSCPDHFIALLKLFEQHRVKPIYLHFFTDGRDSAKYDAIKYIGEVKKRLRHGEIIASLCGRFYAMDRKKDWSHTAMAYNLLTQGKGRHEPDAEVALRHAYNRGESDEFVSPTVITGRQGKPRGVISDDDAVIFFNLRSDRARQLTKPFVQKNFEKVNQGAFHRVKVLKNICFVALTDFGPDLGNILTAYPSRDIRNSLPIALNGLRQLYIAESEKFAHITFFFNGGYDHPVNGEDRVVIASPNVKSYDSVPEMSAAKITNYIIRSLKKHRYDFIGVNFANADMIGHTGNLRAGVLAMETIDRSLQQIAREIKKQRGTMIITADHGNVEEFINPATGEVDTEHSTNPVWFLLYNYAWRGKKLTHRRGVLGDVAPTILALLGLPKPREMTRHSLL
jgi:2,3-bisphosphoglycerate-independent phosphoglycerate mutase